MMMNFAAATPSPPGAPLAAPPAPAVPLAGAGRIPIANIYYLLCYAWDVLKEDQELAPVDALDSTELLDLFARVLVSGTKRLLRRGLDRGYLPCEGALAGVRGKILPGPTLRADLLRRGRAVCAWDELEYDTPPNRILKATLLRLHRAAADQLDKNTRADIHDLLRWLGPVSEIRIRTTEFRRVQLHRNNRIYAFLLHVCEFIHECWLPGENGETRRFRDFVRERLFELFEQFVRNFFLRELPGEWRVRRSGIEWDMTHANEEARALVPTMMTDICLSAPGRAVILDTKFYASALKSGEFGQQKLPSENLYQLFTYLRQKSGEPGWEHAEGILLYPQTSRPLAVDFTTHGHRIRALTLDLAQPWPAIHASLVRMILGDSVVGDSAVDSARVQ